MYECMYIDSEDRVVSCRKLRRVQWSVRIEQQNSEACEGGSLTYLYVVLLGGSEDMYGTV
jgi:hypothetical protein